MTPFLLSRDPSPLLRSLLSPQQTQLLIRLKRRYQQPPSRRRLHQLELAAARRAAATLAATSMNTPEDGTSDGEEAAAAARDTLCLGSSTNRGSGRVLRRRRAPLPPSAQPLLKLFAHHPRQRYMKALQQVIDAALATALQAHTAARTTEGTDDGISPLKVEVTCSPQTAPASSADVTVNEAGSPAKSCVAAAVATPPPLPTHSVLLSSDVSTAIATTPCCSSTAASAPSAGVVMAGASARRSHSLHHHHLPFQEQRGHRNDSGGGRKGHHSSEPFPSSRSHPSQRVGGGDHSSGKAVPHPPPSLATSQSLTTASHRAPRRRCSRATMRDSRRGVHSSALQNAHGTSSIGSTTSDTAAESAVASTNLKRVALLVGEVRRLFWDVQQRHSAVERERALLQKQEKRFSEELQRVLYHPASPPRAVSPAACEGVAATAADGGRTDTIDSHVDDHRRGCVDRGGSSSSYGEESMVSSIHSAHDQQQQEQQRAAGGEKERGAGGNGSSPPWLTASLPSPGDVAGALLTDASLWGEDNTPHQQVPTEGTAEAPRVVAAPSAIGRSGCCCSSSSSSSFCSSECSPLPSHGGAAREAAARLGYSDIAKEGQGDDSLGNAAQPSTKGAAAAAAYMDVDSLEQLKLSAWKLVAESNGLPAPKPIAAAYTAHYFPNETRARGPGSDDSRRRGHRPHLLHPSATSAVTELDAFLRKLLQHAPPEEERDGVLFVASSPQLGVHETPDKANVTMTFGAHPTKRSESSATHFESCTEVPTALRNESASVRSTRPSCEEEGGGRGEANTASRAGSVAIAPTRCPSPAVAGRDENTNRNPIHLSPDGVPASVSVGYEERSSCSSSSVSSSSSNEVLARVRSPTLPPGPVEEAKADTDVAPNDRVAECLRRLITVFQTEVQVREASRNSARRHLEATLTAEMEAHIAARAQAASALRTATAADHHALRSELERVTGETTKLRGEVIDLGAALEREQRREKQLQVQRSIANASREEATARVQRMEEQEHLYVREAIISGTTTAAAAIPSPVPDSRYSLQNVQQHLQQQRLHEGNAGPPPSWTQRVANAAKTSPRANEERAHEASSGQREVHSPERGGGSRSGGMPSRTVSLIALGHVLRQQFRNSQHSPHAAPSSLYPLQQQATAAATARSSARHGRRFSPSTSSPAAHDRLLHTSSERGVLASQSQPRSEVRTNSTPTPHHPPPPPPPPPPSTILFHDLRRVYTGHDDGNPHRPQRSATPGEKAMESAGTTMHPTAAVDTAPGRRPGSAVAQIDAEPFTSASPFFHCHGWLSSQPQRYSAAREAALGPPPRPLQRFVRNPSHLDTSSSLVGGGGEGERAGRCGSSVRRPASSPATGTSSVFFKSTGLHRAVTATPSVEPARPHEEQMRRGSSTNLSGDRREVVERHTTPTRVSYEHSVASDTAARGKAMRGGAAPRLPASRPPLPQRGDRPQSAMPLRTRNTVNTSARGEQGLPVPCRPSARPQSALPPGGVWGVVGRSVPAVPPRPSSATATATGAAPHCQH